MANPPDSVDPFAPPQQSQSADPAHAALEENLAQVLTSLSTLTNCVSNVVPEATEPGSHLPGGLVGHTMNRVVMQLQELQSCARDLDTEVPIEAIELVDQNKNPDQHMKGFLELAALENMYTNGIAGGVRGYRDELAAQMAHFFPDHAANGNMQTNGTITGTQSQARLSATTGF